MSRKKNCLDRLARGHRPPLRQWRKSYMTKRQQLIEAALSCDALTERLRARQPLPRHYAVGFDERAIEYPWLLAAAPSGVALDAGSILNHSYILPHFLPQLESLTISTLAPEPESFPELGIEYQYGDMRELPFADDHFDTVFSLSTLEHVGMDNTNYGDEGASKAEDPRAATGAAVAELRRVVKPGGRVLISVPYGERMDMGWQRQLDRDDVAEIQAALEPGTATLDVYAYSREGWNLSDPDAAAGLRYHDFTQRARYPADRAAAARAVACLTVTV